MYAFFQYLKDKGYNVKIVTNTSSIQNDVLVVTKNPFAGIPYGIGPIITFLHSLFYLFYYVILGNFKVTDSICTVWLVSASPLTAAAAVMFNLMGYRVITQNVLMHSDDPSRRAGGLINVSHKFRRLQYYISDTVTSNSPGLYDLSAKYHSNCIMIPNPVDIQNITKWDRPQKGNYILTVGRLSYRKGTDIVFKTIDIIHKNNPDIQFTFVGPCDNMEGYLQKVYDSCVHINKENVYYAGYQKDIHSYYMNADIFFLPSRKEGFPSVFIEAMAYGLPAVVKKIEGITDFVFQNGYPAAIDSEDPEEYAKLILRLHFDRKFNESVGKKSSGNVTRFDREEIYQRYLNLIVHS